MRLPNKFTSYNESVLHFLPKVKTVINRNCFSPEEIYSFLFVNNQDLISPNQLIDILDILFILGKVKMNEKGNIVYVENNSM